MGRNSGSGGRHHATKQKGKSRRGGGVGTYSKQKKSRNAMRYDRPAITKGFS